MRINGLARVALGVCVVGALALPLSSGCDRGTSSSSGAAKPKVVYITNGVADFWTLAKVGAQTAAKDVDADVEVLMPKNIEEQQRMVQDSLTRGVDGIAISPINSANQGDLINDAAARTKLITHDSDAPNTKRLAYIGMSNYDAGRMCGKLVKEALPDGGSVIIMVGRPEQDNAGLRRQGVIDELLDRPVNPAGPRDPLTGSEIKGEKYTILATMTDQFERPIAARNATDAMNKYDNIGAMVGLFEYNPPMILEAIGDKAGKEIKVIGFDEAQTTLQAIKDGRCHGTIVQDPYRYGYESVKMLAALARGDQSVLPANGFLDIPAKAIKKDNVEEFQVEMNKRLGK